MKRRNFLFATGSCSAHLLSMVHFAPRVARSIFAPQQEDSVIATEPWGRLEEIAKGVYAQIATPFETKDFTTVSNGGFIVGEERILAIEAYTKAAGSSWIANQCKKLTGRFPTDVVITHFHGDHSSGHAGYVNDEVEPRFWLTESTKAAAEKSFAAKRRNAPKPFNNVNVLSSEEPNELDLGGRIVNIIPRTGHTDSDVSIEITDPKVIWTGDLFFNQMFPNYSNAIPNLLNDYAQGLTELENDVVIVPGHGPIGNAATAEIYVDFLGYVQEQAQNAIKAGDDIDAAVAKFELPERFQEWAIWSPQNVKKAFQAWKRMAE